MGGGENQKKSYEIKQGIQKSRKRVITEKTECEVDDSEFAQPFRGYGKMHLARYTARGIEIKDKRFLLF